MRAGPLSNAAVIAELNERFINSWIIIPQIENPDDFFQAPAARDWARIVEDEFDYPVDVIVLSSDGKPVGQKTVEDLFHERAAGYLQLLKSVE